MARTQNDPTLPMDTDIRIPVTADQKRLIAAAVADEPDGLADWARAVLLRAAGERMASRIEPARSALDDPAAMNESLAEIYRLSQSGAIHAAGDRIFDLVHGFLRTHDFDGCDRLLRTVEPTCLEPVLMVTFLSTTLTAKSRLLAREDYFQHVLDILTARRGPERAAGLLDKYR